MSETATVRRKAAPGIDEVAPKLRGLRDEARRAAGQDQPGHDDASVANMRAYLALRRHDNRALQASLARLGLSSLGRIEGHVLATLEQVLTIVERLAEDAPTAAASFDETSALLSRRARLLFGERRPNRETRIMVTLPSEAAADRELVRSLATAGMDCVRINSAHDDLAAWTAMAAHVRAVADEAGRRLPVARNWLAALSEGEQVALTDARGRQRRLTVGAGSADGRWAETRRGAYLVSGTVLTAKRAGETRLGRLPARRSSIRLAVGDTLLLTRDQEPGRPGTGSSPARVSCTLVEAFDAVAPRHSVWLDDGKFGGVVRRVTPGAIEVEITQAPPGGGRLRAAKGINLPDTRLLVAASPRAEEPAIAFAAAHADMLGLSFVSTRDDVRAVADALARHGGDHVGLILKIETRAGFDALPDLIKGPMIVDAIATLDDILARMATHRHKKTSLLRRLRAWTPEPPV